MASTTVLSGTNQQPPIVRLDWFFTFHSKVKSIVWNIRLRKRFHGTLLLMLVLFVFVSGNQVRNAIRGSERIRPNRVRV